MLLVVVLDLKYFVVMYIRTMSKYELPVAYLQTLCHRQYYRTFSGIFKRYCKHIHFEI